MITPKRRVSAKGKISWLVSIRRTGKTAIYSTFKTEARALEFIRETEDRMARELKAQADPRSTLPASGRLEDEKLIDTMLLFRKSDICTDRHRRLLPTIALHVGNVTIGALKPSWAKAYISRMRKTKSKRMTIFAFATIVAHIHMINVVVKWRAEELDVTAPRFSVPFGKLPWNWDNQRTRRLEPGEEEALMEVLASANSPARAQWPLLISLAIETCARLQELVLAEWSEISPNVDFWLIPASHTKGKTERSMPLSNRAIEIIQKLKTMADPKSQRIFHMLGNAGSVSGLFHRRTEAAGLVDYKFHDLRHEGISRFVLTQRDYAIFEIMNMVGHSSPAMTRRYTNLRGDELAKKMTRTPAPASIVESIAMPPSLPKAPAGLARHPTPAASASPSPSRQAIPMPTPAAPTYGGVPQYGASAYATIRLTTAPPRP